MRSVSICIPTFNQAKYLPEAVRSAFAQDYPNCEVWLSDDASTDDTPQVVASLQQEFPKLRAFRQQKNLGMSGNPKWVVRQPQTDFIVKLDSDDWLLHGYVSKLVTLMEAHPKAGYAHCAVFQINDAGNTTRERRLGRAGGFQNADDSLQGLVTGYRVAANVCLFRREALASVDYYKDDLAFADDWDLAVRMADAGWGNIYHPEVLAAYRVWDDSTNVRAKRKLAEVNGGGRVYQEAITPAFLRRQWSLEPVRRAQEAWALAHSLALISPLFSEAERTELIKALRALGGCRRLERRLSMYRLGLGPVLQALAVLNLRARDLVKAVVRRKAPRPI